MSERYGTIIADPPWAYRTAPLQGVCEYATTSTESICALGGWVQSVSARDCALLMWCTWPQMADGLRVMDAWGFAYVTGFPWVKATAQRSDGLFASAEYVFKPRRGVGFWTMGCSEFVMVGRRGKVGAGRTGVLGLLSGDRRQFWAQGKKHSRKPDDLHEYAEAFLPGPYVELFARRQRDGWTCLGGDLGTWITPNGITTAQ